MQQECASCECPLFLAQGVPEAEHEAEQGTQGYKGCWGRLRMFGRHRGNLRRDERGETSIVEDVLSISGGDVRDSRVRRTVTATERGALKISGRTRDRPL